MGAETQIKASEGEWEAEYMHGSRTRTEDSGFFLNCFNILSVSNCFLKQRFFNSRPLTAGSKKQNSLKMSVLFLSLAVLIRPNHYNVVTYFLNCYVLGLTLRMQCRPNTNKNISNLDSDWYKQHENK